MAEEFFGLGHLNNLALMHNGDTVGNETHYRQVVCNKKVSQVTLFLQLIHQVQYLCTHGYVQRGDRFVSDDELGLHDQGAGNTDTLSLTAGEFVRESAGKFRQQTYFGQGLFHTSGALGFGKAGDIGETFADNIVYLGTLVQGSDGVLEDHLDFLGNLFVQGFVDATVDLLAFVDDITAGGRVNAHDGTTNGGLAGAGFAYDTEGFALIYLEGYAADRFEFLAAGTKSDFQIFYV